MKVILLQDVKGSGKKGDIIEAASGYANNFLIRKGLAKVADSTSVNALNQKKDAEAFHREQERQKAIKLKAQLENDIVRISVKSGEQGKFFGSITSKDIADQLALQNIEVDKKKIVLEDNIKTAGQYIVEIKLFPEITAKVKMDIIAIKS